MDFIEQIFGIAPDGGAGTLEFFLFVMPILALCFPYWRRSRLHEDRFSSPKKPARQSR